MRQPLVTVVMPVRNCEKTVAVAIRSVLNQTFYDWKMLVLDDGSTDGTLAEMRRFDDARITVLHDKQSKGLPARLNEGIEQPAGGYYARMDGDDVCYPRRFELQVGYLETHPEVDLVGGGLCVFGKEGRVLGKRIHPADHNSICRRPYSGFPMSHPVFLGKSEWFRLWRFKVEAGGACDQDLLLRSFAQSRFANIPDILIGYREEKIVLHKCFTYRMAFCRSLMANCRGGRYWRTALGLALAAAKMSMDTIAVCSGLQHHLLRHRARPASQAEIAQWRQVWQSANRPD